MKNILSSILGAAFFCLAASSGAADANRFNVLFILADDLGWADTTL